MTHSVAHTYRQPKKQLKSIDTKAGCEKIVGEIDLRCQTGIPEMKKLELDILILTTEDRKGSQKLSKLRDVIYRRPLTTVFCFQSK